LKPDNILVTREGHVKIGLAKTITKPAEADDATRTIGVTDPGTVLGAVAYMSPEQARGREKFSHFGVSGEDGSLADDRFHRSTRLLDSLWRR
jgi:serine/threonine protein kinase